MVYNRNDYINICVKENTVTCYTVFHNIRKEFGFDNEKSCSVHYLVSRGILVIDNAKAKLIDQSFDHMDDRIALKDVLGNTSCLW